MISSVAQSKLPQSPTLITSPLINAVGLNLLLKNPLVVLPKLLKLLDAPMKAKQFLSSFVVQTNLFLRRLRDRFMMPFVLSVLS